MAQRWSFASAHQNDTVLFAAVDDLKERYAELPGFYDIQDTFNLGKRQFDIELTPAGEAAGLLPGDVARQLRNSFLDKKCSGFSEDATDSRSWFATLKASDKVPKT